MAKEINFFELELTQRIIEDFPQLITDEEFIEGRAKLAVQTLLSYDKQGYSLDDCLREAHKVLYEGQLFVVQGFCASLGGTFPRGT